MEVEVEEEEEEEEEEDKEEGGQWRLGSVMNAFVVVASFLSLPSLKN